MSFFVSRFPPVELLFPQDERLTRFLRPRRYAKYPHKHRFLVDGHTSSFPTTRNYIEKTIPASMREIFCTLIGSRRPGPRAEVGRLLTIRFARQLTSLSPQSIITTTTTKGKRSGDGMLLRFIGREDERRGGLPDRSHHRRELHFTLTPHQITQSTT